MKRNFSVSLGPHLRLAPSLNKIQAAEMISLLPVLIPAVIFFRLPLLSLLTVSFIASLAAHLLAASLFQKPLQVMPVFQAALLFSLMIPLQTPWWAAAAACFFMIFLARECLGGTASFLIHPALAGWAFLALYFSENSQPWSASVLLFGLALKDIWWPVMAGGFILSAAAFMYSRRRDWEMPLIYLSLLLGPSWILFKEVVPLGWLMLAGFCFVTDPETTPMAKTGKRFFAAGAGIISALASQFLLWPAAFVFGIAAMNLLTPWLDRKI